MSNKFMKGLLKKNNINNALYVFIFFMCIQIFNSLLILIPLWLIAANYAIYINIDLFKSRNIFDLSKFLIAFCSLVWTIIFYFHFVKLPYDVSTFWLFVFAVLLTIGGIQNQNVRKTILGFGLLIIGIIMNIIILPSIFIGLIIAFVISYKDILNKIINMSIAPIDVTITNGDSLSLYDDENTQLYKQEEVTSKNNQDTLVHFQDFKVPNNYPIEIKSKGINLLDSKTSLV